MGKERFTPIVVGVGDVINRSPKLEDGHEPMQLMFQAIQKAIKDTTLAPSAGDDFQSQIDSLDIVTPWTWPYPDLPGVLSQKLGIQPHHKLIYDWHGGQQPGRMFDAAARRISFGESKVAVVTGGEALASLAAFQSAGKMPPPNWTPVDDTVETVFEKAARENQGSIGALHGIGLPIQVYPLFEAGFRAHRGQSLQENNKESGRLYAEFAKVAESNPLAWSYCKTAETEESIRTVSKKNRMICSPYPLLMNAFNTINLAGACILTSTDYARQLGIPESKWIYPLGGAGTQDSNNFWERPDFYTSPSISRSIDAALNVSGLTKDQIDLFDFYSCFPIVPKIACHHLGLPKTGSKKPITLLGGLTSFGGAGNNYSMHAITEMVRQLRTGNSGRCGLVLANGGRMTYQHAVCISTQPRADGSPYPDADPLPEYVTDVPVPTIDKKPEGEAVIETYTVDFGRDGSPSLGHVVGRLKASGSRFVANHADAATLQQLASDTKEQIGRGGWVRGDPETEGRNLFSFDASGKL